MVFVNSKLILTETKVIIEITESVYLAIVMYTSIMYLYYYYNTVVGRDLLGPPCRRDGLWDLVELFDIVIPRLPTPRYPMSQGLKLNFSSYNYSFWNIQSPCSQGLIYPIRVETNKWTKTR